MRALYKILYKLFEKGMLYYDSAKSMEIGSRSIAEIIEPYLVSTDPVKKRR